MTGPDFSKQQPQQPQQPQYPNQGYNQGYGYQGGGYPPPQGNPPPPGYGYPQAPGYGYPPMVDKPTGWFIVNWLFFWPTAIYSLVKHWNYIDRDVYYGNMAGAQAHAAAVRKHGIIALCISIGLFILYMILILTVFAAASHCISTVNSGGSC